MGCILKKRLLTIFISLGIFLSFTGIALAEFPQVAFPPGQGCLVCHSDKNLKKGKRSLFIDPKIFHKSVHKKQACTGCHLNFILGGELHEPASKDFRLIAGLACRNCHPEQFVEYKSSVHGKAALGGDEKAATCGDCHGSHNIQSFKSKAVKKAFRASLNEGKVCVKCHKDYYDSWNDYYHGRAFKEGKHTKSPVCWTCHNNHAIFPAEDTNSTVNEANLPETCGRCHVGTSLAFTRGYAQMFHQRAKLYRQNFIISLLARFLPFLRY